MRSYKSGMQIVICGNVGHPGVERYADLYTAFMIIFRNSTDRTGVEIDCRVIQAVFMNRICRACAKRWKSSYE